MPKRGCLLLCVVLLVSAQNPGLKASVALTAIEGFKDQAIPVFLSQVSDISIPDQNDKIGSGLTATEVSLTDIMISGLSASTPASNISFAAPDQITVAIGQLTATTRFNWHFKTKIASGGGSGTVDVSNTQVTAGIAVGQTNGRCTVTITGANVSIGNLSVHISGNPLSAVENWIVGLFNHQLKDTIQDALSSALHQQGQKSLDSLLSQMGITTPLGHSGFSIDYNLVVAPEVQPEYITVSSLAMFIETASPNYSPPISPAVQLPEFDISGDEIQIAISDFTLNSGLYAAFAGGLMHYTVTSSMVPASSPVQLTTTSLDSLFPGLEATYGAGLPCELQCQASGAAPAVSTAGGSIGGTATVDVAVMVQGQTLAVGLTLNLSFNATLSLANWQVQANVNFAQVDSISTYDNTLNQEVDASGLTFMLNMALGLAVPYLDQKVLAPGIQLPHIDNLDLSDSTVSVANGYVFVQATPVYHLTATKSFNAPKKMTQLVYE